MEICMTPMRRRSFQVALSLAMLLGAPSLTAAPPERLGVPDVVFVNGKVYTGESGKFVTAIAVKDGKVLAAGTDAEVKALAGAKTQVEDLKRKTVIPGLYDNHVHAGVAERRIFGIPDSGLDLHTVNDLADLQARLKAHAATVPAGTWITAAVPHGTGGHEPFPETALPTRWQLDEATPNHPVVLNRGHLILVNSAALKIAGVTAKSPQPPGGWIDRNAKGEPIGVLREQPAKRIVVRHIPGGALPDDAEALEILRKRLKAQLALGVTSLNIPGVRPREDLRWLEMLYAKEGADLPRSTVQLRVFPSYDMYDDLQEGTRKTIEEIEALSFFTGFGNDRIKLGAIKMSVDGAFSGQAAWLIDSYPKRPGYHGTVRIPPETLYAVAKRAHDLGWQLGIHAIGDDAVQKTVDVIDRVQRESPRADARHYLHHISVKPPEATIKKMAANGIIAAMQPNFTYTIAPFYAQALSPQKLQTNNPQKSLLDAGIRMSSGSDTLPDGPLVGIYGAVTRKGIDGKVYGPGERLSLEQAIYNATVGTAYMTFDEHNRGLLKPGMLADMVVLEDDIFSVDPEQIRTLRVLHTIIGGKTVWSLAKASASEVPNLLAMNTVDPAHGMAHALGYGCDEHEH